MKQDLHRQVLEEQERVGPGEAWALFQLMTSPLDNKYQSIPSKAIQLLAQSLGYPVILVIAMVVQKLGREQATTA